MKIKKLITAFSLLLIMNSFGQSPPTKINTKNGIHFITTEIVYPIAGIYVFKDDEYTIELNKNGTGLYQFKEEPKRAMTWGMECTDSGTLKFVKGFDSLKYILYYKYNTSLDPEIEEEWNVVDFSIHFNSLKMYIKGEGVKSFIIEEAKK